MRTPCDIITIRNVVWQGNGPHLSVILFTGGGGRAWWGHAWPVGYAGVWMAWMAGDMHCRGACVAGRGPCMAGDAATAAHATHPTGIHSCFVSLALRIKRLILKLIYLNYLWTMYQKLWNYWAFEDSSGSTQTNCVWEFPSQHFMQFSG